MPEARAGPLIQDGENHSVHVRDWLCMQLLPLREREDRRSVLRSRITDLLRDQFTGDSKTDERLVEEAVEEQVLSAGRSNVSRAFPISSRPVTSSAIMQATPPIMLTVVVAGMQSMSWNRKFWRPWDGR